MCLDGCTLIETYIQSTPEPVLDSASSPVEYEAFWYPRPHEYPDYGDIPDLEPVDDVDDPVAA